jgi:hypothetical protein
MDYLTKKLRFEIPALRTIHCHNKNDHCLLVSSYLELAFYNEFVHINDVGSFGFGIYYVCSYVNDE